MRDLTSAFALAAGCAVVVSLCAPVGATETEHLGMSILPAPGKVTVDGKFDDWDLTGGVFICGDVENLRDKLSVWFHAMYDAENLYVLARWMDSTPLNNPGSRRGDYGFAGDCLQVRFIARPDTPDERCSHWTCWQDRERIDVMDVEYGRKFDQGKVRDAQTQGALQEFRIAEGGAGYVQEMSIPWKLLVKEGQPPPKAGDSVRMTVEPNFTVGRSGRLTIKDVFRAGVTPDRVFTFMSSQCWGTGELVAKGGPAARPVRLADGRELPVKMAGGLPQVDWTGLMQVKEPAGFKAIRFAMPEDGFISMHIRNAQGEVVRQLLSCALYARGEHEVKWDGLATMNWRTPGEVLPPGEYTWAAIRHKGLHLRLGGWACNAGSAPWDGPTGRENWGGDHGVPACVAADAGKVYLGWSGAEAGKALLACDLDGNVAWKNNRGGMAGAELVAVDRGTVYVQNWGGNVYRLDAAKGDYTLWQGSDSPDLLLTKLLGQDKGDPNDAKKTEKADAMDANSGRLYLAFEKADLVAVVDGGSGKLIKRIAVKAPMGLKAISEKLVYVISGWQDVLAMDPTTGEAREVISGLGSAAAVAVDGAGRLLIGLREPDHQVRIYSREGKLAGTIGRKGGRTLVGKWTPDGLAFIRNIAVDAKGRLWVAEMDGCPKRFSAWDIATGRLIREFFGPTSYGALGGAINPQDPCVMVGQGCEWRIDPDTGRAACAGVITRDGMENARFAVGGNGKLYLALAANWSFNIGPLRIYQRLGEADYRLRTVFFHVDKEGKEIGLTGHGKSASAARTMVWADENGDGQRQPDEITGAPGELKFSGWYMHVTPDLTLYCRDMQFKVTGFTACGSPRYDLANPVKMPLPGFGSADGTLVLQAGDYGVDCGWFTCAEIATGRRLWRYPDNFIGVHGSHRAPPPQMGMIRGSYGPCGSARLPEPVGNAWVIPTNVGEWHILTGSGFYLGRLFQGDGLKVQWPDKAEPGAILDNCPPGAGGEDFGGSIAAGADGKLHLQAGKTGFWNIEVTGLDTVRTLPGGAVTLSPQEAEQARIIREGLLQEAVGRRQVIVKRLTPKLTGDLARDFAGAEIISYKKQDDAAVRSAAAWDDQFLYLAWEVADRTPWANGADAPEFLYARGDTVDFQLGADPKAAQNRTEAAGGDLRLSIGPFRGKPVAVIYRKAVSDPRQRNSRTFSSGVVREYVMDSVIVAGDVNVEVKPRPKGYVVEAAVPLGLLGIEPADGLVLRGDFGATHGDAAGSDTVLRTYWSNQATGIVSDEVFELKMEPKNWGELTFKR